MSKHKTVYLRLHLHKSDKMLQMGTPSENSKSVLQLSAGLTFSYRKELRTDSYFLWLFLGCYQYWAGWVYGFCCFFVSCSTQRLKRQWFWFLSVSEAPQLKVSPHRLGEPENTGILGTRGVTYPLRHGGSDAYGFLLSSFPANVSLTYQLLMKQSEFILNLSQWFMSIFIFLPLVAILLKGAKPKI